MSDFWATRISGATPAPVSAAPAPTAAWWATSPQQLPSVAPTGYSPVPQQQEVPSKARSARSTETCPDCGSDNYFRPDGQINAMTQCYECGFNPRFTHSTSGAGFRGDQSTPAAPAKQLNPKGNSNFNPKQIVAHVG